MPVWLGRCPARDPRDDMRQVVAHGASEMSTAPFLAPLSVYRCASAASSNGKDRSTIDRTPATSSSTRPQSVPTTVSETGMKPYITLETLAEQYPTNHTSVATSAAVFGPGANRGWTAAYNHSRTTP